MLIKGVKYSVPLFSTLDGGNALIKLVSTCLKRGRRRKRRIESLIMCHVTKQGSSARTFSFKGSKSTAVLLAAGKKKKYFFHYNFYKRKYDAGR